MKVKKLLLSFAGALILTQSSFAIEINQSFVATWLDRNDRDTQVISASSAIAHFLEKYQCFDVQISQKIISDPERAPFFSSKADTPGKVLLNYNTNCKNSELKDFKFRVHIGDIGAINSNDQGRVDVLITTSSGTQKASLCIEKYSTFMTYGSNLVDCTRRSSVSEKDFSQPVNLN